MFGIGNTGDVSFKNDSRLFLGGLTEVMANVSYSSCVMVNISSGRPILRIFPAIRR